MNAKTSREKMLYQARLKRQRDEAARLAFARNEGRDEGRQEGERIGQIRLLQRLMGLPETASEELSRLTAEEMDRQIAELQRRFVGGM